jgi:XTP/dITP diphosphohydrolase
VNNTILIATQNPGKMREMQALLSTLDLEVRSARESNLDLSIEETGDTYLENAKLKAMAYCTASGLPALADDSGLEVDALNGAPGLYSARYAPQQGATDADRRTYLLEQLTGEPQPWIAHFHCAAVLALPDGTLVETSGRCDGIIIPEERGDGGFGYDPIFYLPEYSQTMAEIPETLKNTISHRARAIHAMIPIIEQKLGLK